MSDLGERVWERLEPLDIFDREDIPSRHVPERWVPMSNITGRPISAHDTQPSVEFRANLKGLVTELRVLKGGYVHLRTSFLPKDYLIIGPAIRAIADAIEQEAGDD